MNSHILWIMAAVAAIELFILRPRRLRKGARKILDDTKKVYCGAHEYRKVSPEEFPRLDHQFYRRIQDELEREGFRHLADIENVTLARVHPNMRTFIRSMIGDHGAVMSAHYDVQCRRMMRLIQLTGLLPHDLRVIDLETELSDGTFVCTSTATLAGRMKYPPELKTRFMPQGTPVTQLLDEHRRRVSDAMREQPGLQPCRFTSHEEVRAAQNRMNEIKSRFRAGIGYMSASELKQIASPGLKTMASAVAEELENLKQEDSEKDKAGRE